MLFTDTQQRFETINLSATPLIASTNAGGIQDVADTTVKWFKTAVRQLVPCVGDLRIDELRPEQLRDWQTAVSLRATMGLLTVTCEPLERFMGVCSSAG